MPLMDLTQQLHDAKKEKKRAYMKAYCAAHRANKQAYMKGYNAAKSAEKRAYMKAYYVANRETRQAYAKAWRVANPRDRRAYNKALRATKRDELQAQTAAYYIEHRAAILAKCKARYVANRQRILTRQHHCYALYPEKFKTRHALWTAANGEKRVLYTGRYRARKRGNGGAHTVEEWREKCNLLGHICIYCGHVAKRLERDHKVPLARGGTDDIANVVPACRSCNAAKNAKTAHEYLQAER